MNIAIELHPLSATSTKFYKISLFYSHWEQKLCESQRLGERELRQEGGGAESASCEIGFI